MATSAANRKATMIPTPTGNCGTPEGGANEPFGFRIMLVVPLPPEVAVPESTVML